MKLVILLLQNGVNLPSLVSWRLKDRHMHYFWYLSCMQARTKESPLKVLMVLFQLYRLVPLGHLKRRKAWKAFHLWYSLPSWPHSFKCRCGYFLDDWGLDLLTIISLGSFSNLEARSEAFSELEFSSILWGNSTSGLIILKMSSPVARYLSPLSRPLLRNSISLRVWSLEPCRALHHAQCSLSSHEWWRLVGVKLTYSHRNQLVYKLLDSRQRHMAVDQHWYLFYISAGCWPKRCLDLGHDARYHLNEENRDFPRRSLQSSEKQARNA